MVRWLGPIPLGIPIPSSILATVWRVLAGSWFDILWKLLVLGVGAFILIIGLAASTSVAVGMFVSIVLGVTFSDNVRRFLRDIWYRRFTFVGP